MKKENPEYETLQIQDRFEADIIVVGMDYAGIAAVRAARETGADVIGLDEHSCEDIPLAGRNFEHRWMLTYAAGWACVRSILQRCRASVLRRNTQ